MEAIFRIKASEFNEQLINQIKSLLKSKSNLELTIAITEESSTGILRKETREEYFSRLDGAIHSLNNQQGVSYSSEGFEGFSKQMLNEP